MRYQKLIGSCVVMISTLGMAAHAETVIPMNGQKPEQIQMDAAQCQAAAKTSYDQTLASANSAAAATPAPTAAPAPSGGRLKGAAVGAAAGAASAQVRGNQYENYDKLDSDVQQEYRQNQAKSTAAAGAVVGGAKQRQSRRQQQAAQQEQAAQQQQQQATNSTQSADTASKQAYSSCMSGRGYSISP